MVNKLGTPDASNTLHYNFLTILNNDYKKVNSKVDVCLIILVKQDICTNNTPFAWVASRLPKFLQSNHPNHRFSL